MDAVADLCSLVDQSLYPLATCYVVVFVMVFVLLAGNHALPMMLRFIIWLGTKIWRQGEFNETLNFLLDHPRRCVSSPHRDDYGVNWLIHQMLLVPLSKPSDLVSRLCLDRLHVSPLHVLGDTKVDAQCGGNVRILGSEHWTASDW